MKNKKLFAILTLVCFMFTLMPVAAFATDTFAEEGAVVKDVIKAVKEDKKVSSITVTEGKAEATVDFVYNGAPDSNMGLFIVENGELEATTDSMVDYVFDQVGTFEVYAADKNDIAIVMAEKITKAQKLVLLKELVTTTDNYVTVKVKENTTYGYKIVIKENTDEQSYDTDNGAFSVLTPGAKANEWDLVIDANSGWTDKGHLIAELQKLDADKNVIADADLEGVELTISEVGYVDVIAEDGTETDSEGEVAFEVVADRAGDFKVVVKYGTEAKATINVKASAEAVANVELVNAPTAPYALDADAKGADIEFKFTDANGKAFDNWTSADVRVVLTAKPADSNLEEDHFSLVKQELANFDSEDDAAGVWTLAGTFDEEGKYTVKVVLKNGKSATASITVAEQGDIVGIKYDVYNTPRTVAYGEKATFAAVLAYDANGVTKNVAADTKFSANHPAVDYVEDMEKYGIRVGSNVAIKDDNDYVGSQITVYAVHEDFTASTVITVIDQPTTITYADANAEVGVYAEIAGVVVDSEGNRAAINDKDIDGYDVTALVIEKPANAVTAADVEIDGKGNVTLNFLGSEEGTYKVLTTISYKDADSAKEVFVSGTATIVVGAGEGTFEDVVVLSIGANNIVVNSDVKAIAAAPMIKDGRTFVPFRALAEAFGAEVEWVEATQSVVAELNGVKVVMNIGANAYTVNGAAKTADVAPFINGASTMVPVRFVAEAFGITVTPLYAADGTVADVLFAK